MTSAEPERRGRVALHPILVTIPIGCWVASLVFDTASHQVSEPEFLTRGSYWLITVGLIVAPLATLTGLIDALPVRPRTQAYRTLMVHFGLAMTSMLLYLVGYVLRAAEPIDRPVSGTMIALSTIAMMCLATAVVTGGVLAHRHQVGGHPDRGQQPDTRSQHV